MPHPYPLTSVFTGGMRRDVDRTEIPGGSAYNMVDFIPDELQAVTSGRGGWTYAGTPLSGATKIVAAGYHTGTSQLIAIDQEPKGWDALTGSALTGTLGSPIAPPAFHRGKLIFPCNAAVPTYYDGAILNTLAGAPQGESICVYKDHSVLGGTPAQAQRIFFSAAGDPTTWDTTYGWWDTSGDVVAVGSLTNSILIFHADSTERLRGTTPPPGSDMILEPFLPNVGCIDPFSLAYWQSRVVFCSSQGIYMTDGVSNVDLTANAQMKTYWQSLMAGYSSSWRISAGIYRDHYIVSINNGSTLVDCLCVSLLNQTIWRFTNLHGSSFVDVQAAQQEKLYMGQWNAGRVAELSTLWFPSAGVRFDGDGSNPAPLVETGMFRGFDRLHRRWIESMGIQKWRFSFIDYDLRDSASDLPTAALSYCTTPTGSYSQAGLSLPRTSDYARVRRSLSPTQGGATHSNMLGLKLIVNGPYASAKLYTLEGAWEPIEIGALVTADVHSLDNVWELDSSALDTTTELV